MELIAIGADFSANNLGLKEPLDARTIALLANYTKALSTDEQYGVQDFLTTLDDNGIYDNLKHLYLPIIAGAVGEAFINAVDVSYTVDTTPDPTTYELVSGGIRNTTTVTPNASAALVMTPKPGMLLSSFHYMFAPTLDIAGAFGPLGPYGSKIYINLDRNVILSRGITPSSNFKFAGVDINVLVDANNDISTGVTPGLMGWYTNDLVGIHSVTQGNAAAYSDYSSTPTDAELTGTMDLAGWSQRTGIEPCGIYSMGLGLTETQAGIYKDAIDTLFSVFGIAR